MWFAALEGLLAGLIVGVVLLPRWRREYAAPAAVALPVAVVGGLVGGLLGYALVARSTSSGPLQVAAIVCGVIGAAVTLLVLRGWVLGDRAAAAAAVRAAEASALAATDDAARARARERRVAAGPSVLSEIAVAALVAMRRR